MSGVIIGNWGTGPAMRAFASLSAIKQSTAFMPERFSKQFYEVHTNVFLPGVFHFFVAVAGKRRNDDRIDNNDEPDENIRHLATNVQFGAVVAHGNFGISYCRVDASLHFF